MFPLTRRRLLAGLGSVPWGRARAAPAESAIHALTLEAVPAKLPLRAGQPENAVHALRVKGAGSSLRVRQGETLDLTLNNGLPVPLILNWHGLDGMASMAPLTARSPVQPGGIERFLLPLRQAGTILCDARLLGDDRAPPSTACALIVEERAPVPVDRDEIILIEDWRLDPNGQAIAPAKNAGNGPPIYTVNGKVAPFDLTARINERIRFRFINACQRNAIALRIENLEPWIMAIDSQPTEPFLARNGQFVLAPGTRVDAFIDATLAEGAVSTIVLHDGRAPRSIGTIRTASGNPTRTAPLPGPSPLPSNGLSGRLDLKNALRVDVQFQSPNEAAAWLAPSQFSSGLPAAFRVKRGRTVVLTLTNTAASPIAFHLHGHHVRLLDRLDDGWKPFWLDTLLVDTGQTLRVAFAAEFAGQWLMEAMAVQWGSPRLIRWFAVDQ